jgi:iron-sulfur cluster repair protein YtfE (RIC family)
MNWLLSDEFVTFSQKVAEIHAQKKKIKAELKEYYDKVSSQMKSLDKEAVTLSDEFEQWKTEHADKEKVEKTDAGE